MTVLNLAPMRGRSISREHWSPNKRGLLKRMCDGAADPGQQIQCIVPGSKRLLLRPVLFKHGARGGQGFDTLSPSGYNEGARATR
jgi:hypothetical protein